MAVDRRDQIEPGRQVVQGGGGTEFGQYHLARFRRGAGHGAHDGLRLAELLLPNDLRFAVDALTFAHVPVGVVSKDLLVETQRNALGHTSPLSSLRAPRHRSFARADVLVLDDWGLSVLKEGQRQDVLENLEDRDGLRSTIITSQLPRTEWHGALGDPTIADAILDRLIHNAHDLALTGPS